MPIFKTAKTEKQQTDNEEKTDCYDVDDYDKPLTCVMFSNFLNNVNEFSDIERIHLRMAVKLVSIMFAKIMPLIKPRSRRLKQLVPLNTAPIDADHMRFKFQLKRWFGSGSAETAQRVREGILKIQAVLTDPLAIITFINDIDIKKSLALGHRIETSLAPDDEDLFRRFRSKIPQATVGYGIYINEETTLKRLQISGMMRYIVHELAYHILDLPRDNFSNQGHMKSARKNLLNMAAVDPEMALRSPSSWTHFVDSCKLQADGKNLQDGIINVNQVVEKRDLLAIELLKLRKISEESDLFEL